MPCSPGDVALVHAAAGGVGQLLVQLVRARGGTVVATAGGPEKCETARAVGAEHVIDYRAVDDLADEVRRAHRRARGRRGLRRRRQGHLRRVAGLAAAPGDARAVRGGQRPGAAVRHPAAQPGRVALPHPAHARSLPRHPRGAASGGPARCSARWPTAACRWRSVAATRSPRPRRPTPTSRAGAPRASSSSSPDRPPAPPDFVRLTHGFRTGVQVKTVCKSHEVAENA